MRRVLLTNAYWEKNEKRWAEYASALHRNIDSGLFAEIHIQVEGWYPPSNDFAVDYSIKGLSQVKVWLRPWGRMTYADWFMFRRNLGNIDDLHVLANADIYFDDTLKLLDKYKLPETLLCLSRQNVNADGTTSPVTNPALSQDAWIWQGRMCKSLRCDWPLGEIGCDSRVARVAQEADLLVLNPSLSINALHLHESGVRNYGPMRPEWKSDFTGAPVPACSLEQVENLLVKR